MHIIKIYSFLLFLISIGLSVQAQTIEKDRCGTMQLDQHYRQTIPDYSYNRKASEQNIIPKYISNKSAGNVIIPVVIHVIYRLDAQNISDAQIFSQIDVLNKDFNKLNWDTMLVPSVWKSLIADCEIEFKLADRDTNGNVTNGITRTKTTIQDIASLSGSLHYQTSKGGQDIWDRDSYLNIWVCEISGGIYGFASFPGAPSASDGVTIDFGSFGTLGTASFPTDRGRTATHEIGHWFDLFHLWGPNPPCGDDLINDTPEQFNGNFDCPFFPDTSCNNAPNGDMFVNYMDYVDDNCMHMFTIGQKARMLTALNGTRSSLLTSSGYNGINTLNSNNNNIHIFPNPCNDYLQIDFNNNLEINYIELIDIQGSVMYSAEKSYLAEELRLDMNGYNNGIYFIRIQTSQGWMSKKILVNHH